MILFFIFLFGLFWGSFLGVLVDRLPKNENVIKGKFLVIGRLYYYYSLYRYEPILQKVNELIKLVKEYFPNIDLILTDLRELCNEFKSKKYKELEDLFDKIDENIRNIKRSQLNSP